MRRVFTIQPRQSGKTSRAMFEFAKDPMHSLLVTNTHGQVTFLNKQLGFKSDNVITSSMFRNMYIGTHPHTIILDDYLFFKNKDEIWKQVQLKQPKNIYIFTTSDKMYNRDTFELIKKYKPNKTFNELVEICSPVDYIKTEWYDLYYNFITDNDFTIIDVISPMHLDDFGFNPVDKSIMEVEIGNKWLT